MNNRVFSRSNLYKESFILKKVLCTLLILFSKEDSELKCSVIFHKWYKIGRPIAVDSRNMMRKFFLLFFLFLLVLGTGKLWHLSKDGFSFLRVVSNLPKASKNLEEPFQAVWVEKPFFYLGRGHQNYAFVSEDGNYVLKLPRQDLYRPPFWMRSLPFMEKKKELFLLDKTRRKTFLMNSFSLAKKSLSEETLVLFLHLDKSDHLKKKVKLIDQVGRVYFLDLDDTAFLIQKKEPLLFPQYLQARKEKDLDKAKKILTAFLDMNEKRALKKIHNKDPSFLRNFSFDDKERAIQIDVGSFYEDSSQDSLSSFLKMAGHLEEWLKEKDPEMLGFVHDEVEKRCKHL